MNWTKKEVPPHIVKDLSSKFNCDLLSASIFARRGIHKAEDICYFLEDDLRYLHNPYYLPSMEDAVERILAAKDEGEKVLVFGDRDVDGISGTTLLTEYLLSIGLDTDWRIPTGDEAYGLSMTVIEEFEAAGGTLIITVDCGISNIAEVKKANELGIDVIITDHHNQQEEVPEAYAIINPKLTSSSYPFRDLCGCAVAFKLVSALRFAAKSSIYNQPISLLNVRPANDAWIVEIAKLKNLAVTSTLVETIALNPNSDSAIVSIVNTRIPAFLEGQQIFVWDIQQQKKSLSRIFGTNVEIYMFDISPEISREIPSVAGKSLLRIKELSKIAKYQENESSELDIFVSLFTSFINKKESIICEDDIKDLQLACLGTIADIMPLKNENRIIVKQGLKSIIEKPRTGLSDLLFKLELTGRRLSASDISWQLTPAINSAGRMGNPKKAVSLLLEKDEKTRDTLAEEIIKMNEERKKLGSEVWSIIEPKARESLESFNENLALIYGDNIPRGITGIMANRMSSTFKVPSIAVAICDDTYTGSLRSIRGYDLRFLMEPCADLFLDWGGHDYAAGFSMKSSNWPIFLERLKLASANIELDAALDEAIVNIDAELPLNYMNLDIMKIVDLFEPYGESCESLTFLARNAHIEAISLMGKTEAKHVKLTLGMEKHKWPAIYWQAADKLKKDFDLNDRVDLCFKINRNWYN